MAQANITENTSKIVSNTLNTTEVFEKLLTIEFYTGSFVLVSSFMGLMSMYMFFSNNNYMARIRNDIEESEDVVKYNIEINRNSHTIQYDNIKTDLVILNKQLSELIENQQKMVIHFEEILIQMEENKIKRAEDYMMYNRISTSTSMSTFSPIKITNTNFEDVRGHDHDHDYDELINECYDAIPLNNLKKNTGLSWIF